MIEPLYTRRKKERHPEELTFKPKQEGPGLLHLDFFLVNKDWIAQKINRSWSIFRKNNMKGTIL